MSQYTDETLYAEIGRFVVEFEGLTQQIRETIKGYFQEDELFDIVPIEVLMFDSTSGALGKYFQAISLHYLDKKHSDKDKKNIELVKKIINACSTKIIQAGELRNDIVHATWFLSSIYGSNAALEAKRIKVTKDGVLMRKLNIEPGILDNSIWLINRLAVFVEITGELISAGALPVDFYLKEEDIKDLYSTDFEKERTKLFIDDPEHYKNVMKENEEMKNFFINLENQKKANVS
jgi:hypothetical protein